MYDSEISQIKVHFQILREIAIHWFFLRGYFPLSVLGDMLVVTSSFWHMWFPVAQLLPHLTIRHTTGVDLFDQ